MSKEDVEMLKVFEQVPAIIEFSKDCNNPNIAIIGCIRDNQKVVKLYNVDRSKYTPKLKVKEVSHNTEELEELERNFELVAELVFNHNESIESLAYILRELYNHQIGEENDTV